MSQQYKMSQQQHHHQGRTKKKEEDPDAFMRLVSLHQFLPSLETSTTS